METTPSIPATTSIVVMGVSGSGKSTVATELAHRLQWEFIEGDDLHPPENVEKMRSGTPLEDEDRWPWLRRMAELIGEHEAAGTSFILTCSALKRSYRDLLCEGNPSVWFAHANTSEKTLTERLAERQGHYMPPSLLRSQLDTLQPLGDDEPGAVVPGEGSVEETVADLLAELYDERKIQLPG